MQSNFSNIQVLVQVWIGATVGERAGDTDNELTFLFHSLGEKPEMSFFHHAEGNITFLGYNSSCNCWEFEIKTTVNEIVVIISGGNTAVMDCGIRSTEHLFYNNRLTNLALLIDHLSQSFTVASTVVPPKVFKDQHSHGTEVILYSGINFVTTDSYETIQSFQIDGVSSAIQEVAFTLSTVCVIANGVFFILAIGGSSAVQHTGLPPHVIQHVSARGYSELEGHDSSEDLVVIWTHEESESVFVSKDGGFQFEELSLQSGSIHSVLLHPMNKEVNVLVVSEESLQAKFLSYNMEEQDWNNDGLNFSISGGNLTATFFPDDFGDLLVWEDRALYYSPNKGLTVRSLSVYTTDGTSLAPFDFQTEGYIKRASAGPNGQYTVLTYDNQLFYGTTGVGYAVEIQSGLQTMSDAVFSFNLLGELKLVLIQNNSVSIRKVPTYSLLLSSLYPPPACPYLRWNHNVIQSLYYLDSKETLTLWASVIPRQWQPNELSFIVSDPSVISYRIENQLIQTAVAGSIERNMSVYIQPSQRTANRSNALTAVKLLVSNNNLACQDATEVITQFSIRCPPSRHIRIKRPNGYSDRCPNFEDLTYKISKNNYDPDLRGRRGVHGNVDKEVHYNYSQCGCPMRVPYTQTFRPVLELYDGSNFVQEVGADFVIWELHGRSDFKYTTNAENAGCISAPQTWPEMTQDGTYPSIAWTPQTYRHCFHSGGDVLNGRVPYQILNSTGVSSLSWYGHNGIYIFTVTVVATDYSFCNLTATFSVEVYGAIKNSYVGYIFLVLTCVSGVAVLVVSYFCYRYKTGRHEKKE